MSSEAKAIEVKSESKTFVTKGAPEILVATLHQAINWMGIVDKTLSAKKAMGMKMYWDPKGLILRYKRQEYVVPHANVSGASFVME